jgi:hypothetical protein
MTDRLLTGLLLKQRKMCFGVRQITINCKFDTAFLPYLKRCIWLSY